MRYYLQVSILIYPNNLFNSSMRRWWTSALLRCCPSVLFANSVFFRWTSSSFSSIVFSIISFTVVTGFD